MARIKETMPIKIAVLLFAGILIIGFSGYLSYRSISSVVTLIYSQNKPDDGLATIRDITTTIDRAENNVRLYGLTREESYLWKYRGLLTGIDSVIDQLYSQYPEDDWFTRKIDTIDALIDVKIDVWREMIAIWQFDTTRHAMSTLAERFQQAEEPVQAPDTVAREGFFKRIFGRRQEPIVEPPPGDDREEILELLGEIERIEQETGLRLQAKETELTRSSNSLNVAFLSLMAQLETYEREMDLARYHKAEELSRKTYTVLGIFSLSATLLSILVLFLVIKYTRTNRAYNEALIRSRQETEELARAKELFLANVSHEIRTPLNAISGFIKQLLGMPLEKEVKDKIDIVDTASDQLIRLTNDTLDFSKLQAGMLTLNNVHFDPGTEVEEVCALFAEAARKNSNVLSFNVVNRQNTALFGDPQRFRQILHNLLSNALKFTENGKVTVLTEVTGTGEGMADLELVVSDTGPGIAEKNLEKIFKDFTQEDADTSVKYGGTGLGLSIVKKLVELFDGTIGVESAKGIGTAITCRMTFRQGEREKIRQAGPEMSVPPLPGGLRFLVADDEEYNCKLIAAILEKHGAKFDLAMNGTDALQLLTDRSYDVVLMDLRMPGTDGANATRTIRETLNLSKGQLPVIGITADLAIRVNPESRELFNRFLVKPFTEPQLLHILAEVLGLEQAGPAEEHVDERSREPAPYQEGDLTGLMRMSGEDMGFVEEMIGQFEKSTGDGLAEMRSAIGDGRFGSVRELAHKLASPARHLGLTGLLELLKEIERKAPRGNRILLNELVRKAGEHATRASRHLQQQLKQMQS